MQEIELTTTESSETFRVSIQKVMSKSYRIEGHSFSKNISLNKGELIFQLVEDSSASNLLNYSLILPFDGLSVAMTIDVYLNEKTENGEEVQTHQELGLNIEKPIKTFT